MSTPPAPSENLPDDGEPLSLAAALSPAEAAAESGELDIADLCAERVEQLAAALWRSVGNHPSMSLHAWLMAQAMIREVTYAPTASGNSLHDSIREQAYYLWEDSGREPGRAIEFWLTAERLVWESLAPPAGQGRAPVPYRGVDPW